MPSVTKWNSVPPPSGPTRVGDESIRKRACDTAAPLPTSPSSCHPATDLAPDRTCSDRGSRPRSWRILAPRFRCRCRFRHPLLRASAARNACERTTPSTRGHSRQADSADPGSDRHRSRQWKSRSCVRRVLTRCFSMSMDSIAKRATYCISLYSSTETFSLSATKG